jgi:hypothetical protein
MMKAILLVASLVSATPLSIARTERREEQAPMRAADLAAGSRRTPSRSACRRPVMGRLRHRAHGWVRCRTVQNALRTDFGVCGGKPAVSTRPAAFKEEGNDRRRSV